MTDAESHLTEEERHALAEGSLPPEQLPPIEAHLRGCAACSDDVARIKTLMTRISEAPVITGRPPLDELWPSIRSRIEASKVVALSPNAIRLEGRRRARRVGSSIIVAAALVIAAVMLGERARARGSLQTAQLGDTTSLTAVADSAHAYEEEAQMLLNQLELRRSMLRPEAVVAIDHDLRVVDSAIAELTEAIAHDPNNPALRRLLASSYRQKVDVLKRVGNAS
jgi:anti-sigma factor RsiW